MNHSVMQYKRKKQRYKYRQLGWLFAFFDLTIFFIIWLRINIVSTSVFLYLSDKKPIKGPFNPFNYILYVYAAIFFMMLTTDSTKRKEKHWISTKTYFFPVIIMTLLAILFSQNFFEFISGVPENYINQVAFDYFSLFGILIVYAIIRVLIGFDYYLSFVFDSNKSKLLLATLYLVTLIVGLFGSDWFPNLY